MTLGIQPFRAAIGVEDVHGWLFVAANPNLGPEQYYINVTKDGVDVEASALNGFIYACETLKQMLPAAIYGDKAVKANWVLPCVKILDQPRFGYRGMHLDCSRHFWTIEEIRLRQGPPHYRLGRNP